MLHVYSKEDLFASTLKKKVTDFVQQKRSCKVTNMLHVYSKEDLFASTLKKGNRFCPTEEKL